MEVSHVQIHASELTAVLLLSGPNSVVAQLGGEAIDRGKKATALVAISHDGLLTMGTAFCIDKTGLFLTTAGVVETAARPQSVLRLVMDIGLPSQRIMRGKVLRRDVDANLALLQAEGKSGFTPLELGCDSGVKELSVVVVFGYPFGRMLAIGRGAYPDVSHLPSRISSRNIINGHLDGFGLEARISRETQAVRCSTARCKGRGQKLLQRANLTVTTTRVASRNRTASGKAEVLLHRSQTTHRLPLMRGSSWAACSTSMACHSALARRPRASFGAPPVFLQGVVARVLTVSGGPYDRQERSIHRRLPARVDGENRRFVIG